MAELVDARDLKSVVPSEFVQKIRPPNSVGTAEPDANQANLHNGSEPITFKIDTTHTAEDPSFISGRRPADEEAFRFVQWLGIKRPNLSMLRAAVANAGFRLSAPLPSMQEQPDHTVRCTKRSIGRGLGTNT